MIGKTVAQYEILEQLGSGGMGVVYKANDTKLGRTVALKFLPPQLSADKDVKERFIQEARAASSLDDPHICTVHDIAEDNDGQLFIVMAYYDGNTLKYVLDERRPGVEEAAEIARQIASGLAAAHEAGIVHRDVKPANIMLTSKGLVKILDFGVAKLGESSLVTRAGSTVGTAAYMSPEQARGESVDVRSDIWSVGAVLFEMLTGERPFGGGYEAAVAYAILNEEPKPIQNFNPDVPEGLAAIVARCLAKNRSDRFESSLTLTDALRAFSGSTDFTSVSTGSQDTASSRPSYGVASTQKIAAIFSVIAAVVLAGLYGAMIMLGLPDWVFPVGVLLILAGLPIVLYAASLEKKRSEMDTGRRENLTGLASWLTMRRAYQGGLISIGSLLVVTAVFVGLKIAGVGPFATLISGGTLSAQDLLIVADFENKTNDPTLGTTVTEAFRIDLSQSTAVRMMDRSAARSALMRMSVNADTSITTDLALSVAAREGAKAIIAGDINAAGASFILNARILSGVDGSQLAAFRENARSDTDIVDAIDKLSASLREAIGESLVDIRSNDPLEQVTTPSFEALRLYSEAEAMSTEGIEIEAIDRLKSALEIDSTFAMAYRKLAVLYQNTRADVDLRDEAASKAYLLRDRLPQRERLLAEAYYQSTVETDIQEESRLYEELLKRYPYDLAALNNLAINYSGHGRHVDAEQLLRKALSVSDGIVFRQNLIVSLVGQGRTDDATEEAHAFAAAFPTSTLATGALGAISFLRDDFDSAQAWFDSSSTRASQPFMQADIDLARANIDFAQGKIRSGTVHRLRRIQFDLDKQVRDENDLPRAADSLVQTARLEMNIARMTGNTAKFEQAFAAAMNAIEDAGGGPADADFYMLYAFWWMSAGNVERASYWKAQDDAFHARTNKKAPPIHRLSKAWVDAMDGGDVAASIKTIEGFLRDDALCQRCFRDVLGGLYEMSGNTEAAIAAYEQFVLTPEIFAIRDDVGLVALSQFRLGALYEEKGELDRAIEYYSRMAERWKDADTVLQPQVAEANRRVESLLDRKAREN